MVASRKTAVALVLAVTVTLAACATAARDPSPTARDLLKGSEWDLLLLNAGAPIQNTEITLHFSDSSLDGSAGCNTYGGSYETSADSLNVSDLYATEMGCLTPEGVLEQEQSYLQALRAAARFRLDNDRLELYDKDDAQTLVYVAARSAGAVGTAVEPQTVAQATASSTTPTTSDVPPTTAPSTATATEVPATIVPPTASPTHIPATIIPPTATPTIEPPEGFVRYVNDAAGVSLWLPESWTVVEPEPLGDVPIQSEVTILQSYPPDKYIGGERRQPGDTKCDLAIHPPDVTVADLVEQTRSSPTVTIVSEQEIVLMSGIAGTRMEIDSMGRSLTLKAEINGRAVVLSCFGELEPFDEIAVTLSASK